MLLKKTGTISDLSRELVQETKFLSEHLFRANWQLDKYKATRDLKPFPERTVMMVLDFAENFACNYQDEVSSAHWNHDQVNFHK